MECEGCGLPLPPRKPGPGRHRRYHGSSCRSKARTRAEGMENDRLRSENGVLRERLEAATGEPALIGAGGR